jgi:hypothetical protein
MIKWPFLSANLGLHGQGPRYATFHPFNTTSLRLPTSPGLSWTHRPVKMQTKRWTDTISTTMHLLCSVPPFSSTRIPGLRTVHVRVPPPQISSRARACRQTSSNPPQHTGTIHVHIVFLYQL